MLFFDCIVFCRKVYCRVRCLRSCLPSLILFILFYPCFASFCLPYIALPCLALHTKPLLHTTVHHATVSYTKLHYTTLHHTTLHYTILNYTTPNNIMSSYNVQASQLYYVDLGEGKYRTGGSALTTGRPCIFCFILLSSSSSSSSLSPSSSISLNMFICQCFFLLINYSYFPLLLTCLFLLRPSS